MEAGVAGTFGLLLSLLLLGDFFAAPFVLFESGADCDQLVDGAITSAAIAAPATSRHFVISRLILLVCHTDHGANNCVFSSHRAPRATYENCTLGVSSRAPTQRSNSLPKCLGPSRAQPAAQQPKVLFTAEMSRGSTSPNPNQRSHSLPKCLALRRACREANGTVQLGVRSAGHEGVREFGQIVREFGQ